MNRRFALQHAAPILLLAAGALGACQGNGGAAPGSSSGGNAGRGGSGGHPAAADAEAPPLPDAAPTPDAGPAPLPDADLSADAGPPAVFVVPAMPPVLPPDAPSACLRTVHATDDATLQAAIAKALPGDCIDVANGNYASVTIAARGTATSPIVIRAVNQGQAAFTSGLFQLTGASYVTVAGFAFTGSGGTSPVDGKPQPIGFLVMASDHCRISRNTFRLQATPTYTQWLMISGNSDGNRIDHNDFGPNAIHGCHYIWPAGVRDIPGSPPPADRTAWAKGGSPVNPNMARNTRIDHNHLHDQMAGTAEAMVLGALGTTGDYQDTGTVVESNLFENCDGDPEIVSVKSSSNVIRWNTVRTSAGMFSLRAGNKNVVYGNFMFQGGKVGAGGIKIYEDDHTVYDNYIDSPSEYPILVGAGDKYDSATFTHAQVNRARIVHNTVVNAQNRPVIIGHGSTDKLPATDCIFANNILVGSAKTLFDQAVAPVRTIYAGNVIFPGKNGDDPTAFRSVDPALEKNGEVMQLSANSPAIDAANMTFAFVTDDVEGQPRDKPDIGADERAAGPTPRKPLTAADVGPNAP